MPDRAQDRAALRELPGENAISGRYLAIITRWIRWAMDAGLYAPWKGRPDCGHFLGGLHWYGHETALPLLAIAAATSSPDFDEELAGRTRAELREAVRCAIRYLCFTHDTGPEDCVRPATGWNDRPAGSTKWGERGQGFFQESQCGTTVAAMVLAAALLPDGLGDEEHTMLAAVAGDLIDRFGKMEPGSGVYVDSQMEENAWTGLGLTGALMLLPDHPDWDEVWENTKRWTFRACAAPEDITNPTPFDEHGTVADWNGKCCTILPDGTVENHAIVHPFYAASSIFLTSLAEALLRVHGQDVPPHFHWRRREIYATLKTWCDDLGVPHAIQGMDWPYFFVTDGCILHGAAAAYLRDPDASLLHELALHQIERSSEAHGGRCVPEEVARFCHDQQDCMVMRELMIWSAVSAYLAFRLTGPAPEPPGQEAFLRSIQGVHVYPHGGALIHVHSKGRTSFSWRNGAMVLPGTREGVRLLGRARGTLLAEVTVRGKLATAKQVALRIREEEDHVCALLIEDIAQGSVRRQVFFASLPSGTSLVHECLVALTDVTVDEVRQGYVSIMNDGIFAEHPDLRGHRRVYWEGHHEDFEGYATGAPDGDIIRPLTDTRWVNVDDRIGFVFQGSGVASYTNRHNFRVWHAIADDLVLSQCGTVRDLRAGSELAEITVLCCPEQSHQDTRAQTLSVSLQEGGVRTVDLDGFRCTWSFHNPVVAAMAELG